MHISSRFLSSCKKDISSHQRSCKFSDPENEVDLILPASSRRQKISMILQFAPLTSNLGVGWSRGSIVDVECLGKCPAMVKARLSPFQKPMGELDGKRVSQIVLKTSGKLIQPGSGKLRWPQRDIHFSLCFFFFFFHLRLARRTATGGRPGILTLFPVFCTN